MIDFALARGHITVVARRLSALLVGSQHHCFVYQLCRKRQDPAASVKSRRLVWQHRFGGRPAPARSTLAEGSTPDAALSPPHSPSRSRVWLVPPRSAISRRRPPVLLSASISPGLCHSAITPGRFPIDRRYIAVCGLKSYPLYHPAPSDLSGRRNSMVQARPGRHLSQHFATVVIE
ncbi:hypothetical protein K458DRAFT_98557 [Lentithecium fluviatile CBS 122367]|uniref:Uncharacterized protein n=1 Tax=Lentithecium fluviatile CBS 122367 TaxID=1168545 RepID=A0A6G1JHX8_9PLEO|nr:hypothetical protein K458DRAFT_98557 [Lentithecium fluviatile CBS 122367]